MSLEIVPSPGQLIQTGGAAVRAKAKSEIRSHADALLRQQGIPPSPQAAIQAFTKDLSRRAGLPNIPTSPGQITQQAAGYIATELGIPLPTSLSVDGLLSMAKNLPIKLPFPIPVPFPTTVKAAVELGLRTAAQLIGPQVLAAIGLGSVVPGIGNAIGAMIAMGSMLVAFLKSEDPKAVYFCRSTDPRSRALGDLYVQTATPLLTMAYRQLALSEAKKVLMDPALQSREGFVMTDSTTGRTRTVEGGKYAREGINQCITDMELLIRDRLGPVVRGTAASTPLPMVLHALTNFDLAQQTYPRMQEQSQRVVAELKTRLAHLQKILSEYDFVTKTPPPADTDRVGLAQRMGRVHWVEVEMLKEIQYASTAVQLSTFPPGTVLQDGAPAFAAQAFWQKSNLEQLALATSMWSQLHALQAQLNARYNIGRAPKVTTQAAHEEQMRKWQEAERGAYRPGLPTTPARPAPPRTAPPVPIPVRPPMPTAPRPTPAPVADPARTFCWNLYQDWFKKNPRQAACLTTTDRDWILNFCYDAHGPSKKWTIPQSLERIQMVISMACKKKGIAA
jgi:hypothetical protein